MRLLGRLYKGGQSTTELAIIGSVILVVLASLLKYGQLMNKQQEIRMQTFRSALNKAYTDYDNGKGMGGVSYTALKNANLVSPNQDFYTGRQRQSVQAAASVLWDPDLFYADDKLGPNSYVQVDGQENKFDKDASIEGLDTDATLDFRGAEQIYRVGPTGIENTVHAEAVEHLTTKIRLKGKEPQLVQQDNTYTKDETWQTPW